MTIKTIENAKTWKRKEQENDDPFVFCLTLMDLSLVDDGDRKCARRVAELEYEFEQILQADALEAR